MRKNSKAVRSKVFFVSLKRKKRTLKDECKYQKDRPVTFCVEET